MDTRIGRPDDPDGIPDASRGRRFVARAIDVITTIGGPWVLLLLLLVFALPFGVAVIIAGPVLLPLSIAAAIAAHRVRRQPGGDRISLGQLAAGLTVLRDEETKRVVRSADIAEDERPSRRRVAIGRVAAAVLSLVGIVMILGSATIVIAFQFQEAIAAAQERDLQEHAPEARSVCDAFLNAMLSDEADAGVGLVADEAARRLPDYRERIRSEGVTGFELYTIVQGTGYEYVFREMNPATAGQPIQTMVCILVRQRGDRFAVTGITPSLRYTAPEEATADTTASTTP
ncbi:MAG: hypothetical protein Q7V61_03790 [Actinomycetota bacterium]|nr:hypothetical protein [Actinomycetota bacterium]